MPLDDSATADPNDEVIGVDFSGGMAAVVAQLNTALRRVVHFSNPSGSTLRVDGISGVSNVDDLSVTRTATALAGGDPALALFTDGFTTFSGAISAVGSQTHGFAGRIAINAALLADPSKLVKFDTSTASGDPTRPNYIYDQLTEASFFFSPKWGSGRHRPSPETCRPICGKCSACRAKRRRTPRTWQKARAVVVNALQQRVNDASGVNVDQEMADLIALQTAYGANARVMSVVREMIETLLKM